MPSTRQEWRMNLFPRERWGWCLHKQNGAGSWPGNTNEVNFLGQIHEGEIRVRWDLCAAVLNLGDPCVLGHGHGSAHRQQLLPEYGWHRGQSPCPVWDPKSLGWGREHVLGQIWVLLAGKHSVEFSKMKHKPLIDRDQGPQRPCLKVSITDAKQCVGIWSLRMTRQSDRARGYPATGQACHCPEAIWILQSSSWLQMVRPPPTESCWRSRELIESRKENLEFHMGPQEPWLQWWCEFLPIWL